MRFGPVGRLPYGRTETEHDQGECPLSVLGHKDRAGGVGWARSSSAEDRPDARGRVLQVWAGVAGHRQHPADVERIAGMAGNRQVCVLERADADRFRYLFPLSLLSPDDVNEPVRLQVNKPVPDRRDVCGAVAISALSGAMSVAESVISSLA